MSIEDVLRRARADLMDLAESVHSMRGDPRLSWQEDDPHSAETMKIIDWTLEAIMVGDLVVPAGKEDGK